MGELAASAPAINMPATIDFVCAEFIFLTAIGVFLSEIQNPHPRHHQFAFTILIAVLLVLDGLSYIPEYVALGDNVMLATTTLRVACDYGAIMFFHIFTINLLERRTERTFHLKKLALPTFLVAMGIWFIALATDVLVTADASGIEALPELRVIIALPACALLMADMTFLIKNRRRMDTFTLVYLLLYLIIITLMALLVVKLNNVGFSMMAALLVFVSYVISNIRKSQLLVEQEKKLAQSRLDTALSQIQPHFLYNSLNSIYHLIDIDPGRAQEMVSEFSDYLRMNLSTISSGRLVPFETELHHVRTYLNLEKMRFGDDLQVHEDIRCTQFFVPPLSIQPLVENAVKHGICQKEDGGSVTISAWQGEKGWLVCVSDDGVGFDTSDDPESPSSHIGLENTAERLRAMCNATLTIESEPGKGTTATVFFPGYRPEQEIA